MTTPNDSTNKSTLTEQEIQAMTQHSEARLTWEVTLRLRPDVVTPICTFSSKQGNKPVSFWIVALSDPELTSFVLNDTDNHEGIGEDDANAVAQYLVKHPEEIVGPTESKPDGSSLSALAQAKYKQNDDKGATSAAAALGSDGGDGAVTHPGPDAGSEEPPAPPH